MPGHQGNAEELFKKSQDDFLSFPGNLLQKDLFQYSLEEYVKKLKDEEAYFDDEDESKISFLDFLDGQQAYKSLPEMQTRSVIDQLQQKRSCDPQSRFVFIQSATHRCPLQCSKEQLLRILTHHQVMESFLDFVFKFTYGDLETRTAFRHEDHLDASNTRFALTQLGRSGQRYQHCFNLISVEYEESQSELPWPLRQTALYHSFDVVEGRSFWISLKGNDLIKTRITNSTETHTKLKPDALTSSESKFQATLLIHLLLFEWCTESWPGYIKYLGDQVKQHSDTVRFTAVDKSAAPEIIERAAVARRSTMNLSRGPSRQGTRDQNISQQGSWAPKLLRELSNRLSPRRQKSQRPSPQPVQIRGVDFDDVFKFTEAQNLGVLFSQTTTALDVIEQDIKVMNDIMEHYSAVLLPSPGFRAHMDIKLCESSTANFLLKGRRFVRDMENHASSLRSTLGALDKIKSEFQGILQYRNMRTGEYFAQSAYDTAMVMEELAIRTKQETVSMHAVTILTLLFLPGTFVAVSVFGIILLLRCFIRVPSVPMAITAYIPANVRRILTLLASLQTVFGSGVLNWDQDDNKWAPRREALTLYLAIVVPSTIVTLGAWSIWYCCSQRRIKKVNGFVEMRRDDDSKNEKNVGRNVP